MPNGVGLELSRGPVIDSSVERAVHVIFYPEGEWPGSDVMPTSGEREIVAGQVGDVQPTDVIIYRRRPWHKVDGALREHPQVHHDYPHTVLTLRVEMDRAVWWSEHVFAITQIVPHEHAAGATDGPEPFARPATRAEIDIDGRGDAIYVARSVVPRAAARNHEYKINLTRQGIVIDPNMRCT